MRTIKIIAYLALMLITSDALANRGVAFVHGTGNPSDALNDYWTRSMVDSVRSGLPNPSRYVVTECNFDKYMWDPASAGCLAQQLTDFINQQGITQLVIITHSNGGNVVRWIMSNPNFDSRYANIINRIQYVLALAPSSKGTPLADAVIAGNSFESALGWILGFQSDAVRMQQVSWMAYYNANYLYGTSGRPGLPRGFYNIVGTDVDSAIWDSDSYCAGYQNQVALEVTQAWLNSCSDGFLECSSQSGAGVTWFNDINRTNGSEPLSHQQSRRDCFGLDTILRSVL